MATATIDSARLERLERDSRWYNELHYAVRNTAPLLDTKLTETEAHLQCLAIVKKLHERDPRSAATRPACCSAPLYRGTKHVRECKSCGAVEVGPPMRIYFDTDINAIDGDHSPRTPR